MDGYLYGASCQGIQSFVFETDKLQEIIGGSELVEQLCTSMFTNLLQQLGIREDESGSYGSVVSAAGNIRYLFQGQHRKYVEKLVREFPIFTTKMAPGITISQAVVWFTGDLSKDDMNLLEQKLKAQRNRNWRPADLGFLAVERCRRTARPAVKWDKPGKNDGEKGEPIDSSLAAKREANCQQAPLTLFRKLMPESDFLKITHSHIPFEMEEMIDPEKSEWLAIIHADGNNLGKMLQTMAKQLENNPELKVVDAYKEFSTRLDNATVEAVQKTCGQVILKDDYITRNSKIPIRPIVIGGDDLTVICRADLALEFTRKFLVCFQEQTKKHLEPLVQEYELDQFTDGLTACAGIAFVKPKYPFHYGADLAEELCGAAKKVAKDKIKDKENKNVPASLAFYKIRSTFLESYQDVCEKELRAGINREIDLNYGPYFLDSAEGYSPTLSELIYKTEKLRSKDAPTSSLRKWLSALDHDREEADLLMTRIQQIITTEYLNELDLNTPVRNRKTPVGDWLSLLSVSKE